jgi:hypothetical protein
MAHVTIYLKMSHMDDLLINWVFGKIVATSTVGYLEYTTKNKAEMIEVYFDYEGTNSSGKRKPLEEI